MKLVALTLLMALWAGALAAPPSMRDLVFLTRSGCRNTPVMRGNLDKALKALKLRTDYEYVNIGTLPATDVRTGYPTPTLLYKGLDLFGMSEPKPPLPEPT